MSSADAAKANMERGMSIAQGMGREAGGSLAPAAPPPPMPGVRPAAPAQVPPASNPDIKITLAR